MTLRNWLSRNQCDWNRAANLNVGGYGPKPGYQKKVRDYLTTNGPRTVGEVAAGTGLTLKQAYSALRGFAVQMAGGVWRLPDEQK